jgi:hypothetical protein
MSFVGSAARPAPELAVVSPPLCLVPLLVARAKATTARAQETRTSRSPAAIMRARRRGSAGLLAQARGAGSPDRLPVRQATRPGRRSHRTCLRPDHRRHVLPHLSPGYRTRPRTLRRQICSCAGSSPAPPRPPLVRAGDYAAAGSPGFGPVWRAPATKRTRAGSSGTTTRFTYSAPPRAARRRTGSHRKPY